MQLKPDPGSTAAQIHWRLRDPADFKRCWTATWYRPRGKTDLQEFPNGITAIVGLLRSGGRAYQSLRFARAQWPEKAAAKWWAKHEHEFERRWRWK
jgi:hypothetical protein